MREKVRPLLYIERLAFNAGFRKLMFFLLHTSYILFRRKPFFVPFSGLGGIEVISYQCSFRIAYSRG
jgi:hypothetical protein